MSDQTGTPIILASQKPSHGVASVRDVKLALSSYIATLSYLRDTMGRPLENLPVWMGSVPERDLINLQEQAMLTAGALLSMLKQMRSYVQDETDASAPHSTALTNRANCAGHSLLPQASPE